MAEGIIQVSISVNNLFQQELMKVIQAIYEEHRVMITGIEVDWYHTINGDSRITSCEVRTELFHDIRTTG